MSVQRLTAEALGVHTDGARGYASELESDAGSVAGDIEPSSGQAPHDPYKRSGATFRGAMAALGPVTGGATRTIVGGSRGSVAVLTPGGQPLYGSDFGGLSAFARHQRLASEYVRYYGGGPPKPAVPVSTRTDADTLRESYRFVRSSADDEAALGGNAEQRMAKRYYDRLFREYALADMTHYRSGRVGLRWRTAQEVLDGRGQFTCGNKRCTMTESLQSFELNFGYSENGELKQALVKLRTCVACTYMLHYRKVKALEAEAKARRREEKAIKREAKSKKKKKSKSSKRKRHDPSDNDSESSSNSDADVETLTKKARLESAVAPHSSSAPSPAAAAANSRSSAGFAVPLPRPSRTPLESTAPSPAGSRLPASPASSTAASSSFPSASPARDGVAMDDFLAQMFP